MGLETQLAKGFNFLGPGIQLGKGSVSWDLELNWQKGSVSWDLELNWARVQFFGTWNLIDILLVESTQEYHGISSESKLVSFWWNRRHKDDGTSSEFKLISFWWNR